MNEILWYVSRATGSVTIVLLTTVLVLGVLTSGRRKPHALGPAVVAGLHRSLALGTSVFLLVHIATAIGETYVDIDLVSALVPFTSGYERVWVGLGTLAFDIVLAVVATSLLRHRLSRRAWRAVHLLAFALWPMSVVHGFAMGTAAEPVLRGTTVGCAAVGLAAISWRLASTSADRARRQAVALQEWS